MINGAHSIIYSTDPVTHLTLPGGGRLGVYQPRHARPEPVAVEDREA